jgi:hypothetical protein
MAQDPAQRIETLAVIGVAREIERTDEIGPARPVGGIGPAGISGRSGWRSAPSASAGRGCCARSGVGRRARRIRSGGAVRSAGTVSRRGALRRSGRGHGGSQCLLQPRLPVAQFQDRSREACTEIALELAAGLPRRPNAPDAPTAGPAAPVLSGPVPAPRSAALPHRPADRPPRADARVPSRARRPARLGSAAARARSERRRRRENRSTGLALAKTGEEPDRITQHQHQPERRERRRAAGDQGQAAEPRAAAPQFVEQRSGRRSCHRFGSSRPDQRYCTARIS